LIDPCLIRTRTSAHQSNQKEKEKLGGKGLASWLLREQGHGERREKRGEEEREMRKRERDEDILTTCR
jgi:hypothetical protein